MSSVRQPHLETARQAEQVAFAAGSEDIEVGDAHALPWPLDLLAGRVPGTLPELQRFDDGLTAVVHRLRGERHDWTLKRARPQALVHNVDGQTSFLNEVQRRRDIEHLKARPDAAPRWAGLVDTHYAGYRAGVILSPWIDGEPVRHFNSASRGNDQPLFHPAERFETRNFSAVLLDVEIEQGAAAAVIEWLDGILRRWREGLGAGDGAVSP